MGLDTSGFTFDNWNYYFKKKKQLSLLIIELTRHRRGKIINNYDEDHLRC